MKLENPNEENDYVLEGKAAWITVGNISVYIHKTDEGVVADMYAKHCEEMDDALLATTYAFFAEAKEVQEAGQGPQ